MCGLRAFGAGLAACSAAAVVAQAQAVAVQQAQQQGSGLAAGLAALGYGGSPLGALGSPAQLQSTGTHRTQPSSPEKSSSRERRNLVVVFLFDSRRRQCPRFYCIYKLHPESYTYHMFACVFGEPTRLSFTMFACCNLRQWRFCCIELKVLQQTTQF